MKSLPPCAFPLSPGALLWSVVGLRGSRIASVRADDKLGFLFMTESISVLLIWLP
jgi:hypothetical protein